MVVGGIVVEEGGFAQGAQQPLPADASKGGVHPVGDVYEGVREARAIGTEHQRMPERWSPPSLLGGDAYANAGVRQRQVALPRSRLRERAVAHAERQIDGGGRRMKGVGPDTPGGGGGPLWKGDGLKASILAVGELRSQLQ